MPAYLVYVCRDVWDRKELENYWDAQTGTYDYLQHRVLSSYQKFELLEGDGPVQGIVISEFPDIEGRDSMESARGWFNDEPYTRAREHRNRGADYLGLLCDGAFTPIEQRLPQSKRKPTA
jgi:uncharacterized protein (DUF1330 family)